jgi:hypothetical protein
MLRVEMHTKIHTLLKKGYNKSQIAAIIEADFYEPVMQKNYAALATHYGFYAQPCRVYMPTKQIPSEVFELLINDEVLNRQNNSNRNRVKRARFNSHKTLEATCEFIRKR